MPLHTTPPIAKIKCSYRYDGQTIPFVVWSNVDAEPVRTIIFLGTVHIENSPKWIAQGSPPNTLVVQGAPHWFAKDDGSDIPEYMFGFTKYAFDMMLAKHDVDEVHVIAESQAAPAVIGLFAQGTYHSHLKKLTLLQPLGLNNSAFGEGAAQRLRVFKRRVTANAVHQLKPLLHDKRLRYNHRLLRKTIGLRDPKARAQYSSGLGYNAIPLLQKLYAHNKNVSIVCGARDKVFVPAEIVQTLRTNDLDIEVKIVSGVPHSPLATKYGQLLLREVWEMP